MNRLEQAWVWLRRIGHCRGFGIQAPDDYRFVRYVVNEHWPYHAYDQLPRADQWVTRKLGRLYLRMANHLQPQTIVDLVGMKPYLMAGCRRARVADRLEALEATPPNSRKLIVAPAGHDAATLTKWCDDNTTLVVNRLWEQRMGWEELMQAETAITTFDLYYCGIVSFRPRPDRHHYVVNF